MDFLAYSICFGVGLLFALVSAFLGHLFGGHDAHVDVGAGGHAESGLDHGGMPGLSPFSPTVVASFITAFGGFGLMLSRIEATQSPWISAPLAALGGLLIAAGVISLFGTIFRKTQGSSESRVGMLIGLTGTIITPIPMNGVGEIAYVDRGSRYTAPARNERSAPINAGQTVTIVRMVGSQMYVTPL
jgi:membrane protein implicated in regulation of membrane protease activity